MEYRIHTLLCMIQIWSGTAVGTKQKNWTWCINHPHSCTVQYESTPTFTSIYSRGQHKSNSNRGSSAPAGAPTTNGRLRQPSARDRWAMQRPLCLSGASPRPPARQFALRTNHRLSWSDWLPCTEWTAGHDHLCGIVVFVHEHEYDAPGLVFRYPGGTSDILYRILIIQLWVFHLLYSVLSIQYSALSTILCEKNDYLCGWRGCTPLSSFWSLALPRRGEGGIPLREKIHCDAVRRLPATELPACCTRYCRDAKRNTL